MTHDENNWLMQRLSQSEDPWVERKQSYNEKEVRRTVVGFANSLGEGQTAVMFVGADNKGRHKGVSDADDTQKKIDGILQRCYPPIEYKTRVVTAQADGKQLEILAILVPFSTNRPHFAGPAYIRRGSQTISASHEQFLELIASQNEKSRRILQFKDKKCRLRLRSRSGFWYDFDAAVIACDAHSATFKEDSGVYHTFSVGTIELESNLMHPLQVTAIPPGTEAEHIGTMIERWYQWRPKPEPSEWDLPHKDHLLDQFLANPEMTLPIIAAEAEGTTNPWLRLLLIHARFEIKKTKSPMTPEQKMMKLREAHQNLLANWASRGWVGVQGPGYASEVGLALDLATSVSEAFTLLENITRRNPRDTQEYQRQLLHRELGLPEAIKSGNK